MVPLVVEVEQVLVDDATQVDLAEQDHPTQALLLDRPDEALRVRVGVRGLVRRLDELDPRSLHHDLVSGMTSTRHRSAGHAPGRRGSGRRAS